MSKYVALEWDEREIRLAIASQRGATAVLERAFTAALPPSADGKPLSASAVAGVLREALGGESLRKAETLAVVGRPSIELKELSLPPAPDDELADMVRFQALRDFTQLSDDMPLDFIPLPGEDTEHRSVLAAAISQDLLTELRATCEQAGLQLNHLVLRPCAAASLLSRHQPAAAQVRMFVDLLGDEVDLTVLDHDTPLLMRTTRLPGDASQPEFSRPVFLEVRRTIAAVQNKLHGRRVEAIWLCGDGPSQQTLAEMIKSELDLPTELFDPFTGFEQSGGMRSQLPAHHSRFAPILGMLADAAAGKRHGIDFLDPRRRPVAKTRRREMAIAAAVAAVLVLMFVGWTWWRLNSLDDEIAQLNRQKRDLDAQVKQNAQVEKDAAELDKWLAGDVPWLDVLYRLSTKGPKAEEAMLTGFRADVEKGGGGKLTLDVLAANSDVSKRLASAYTKTTPGTVVKDAKSSRYPLKFKADITIDQETIKTARETLKSAPGKSPADKSGKTKVEDPKNIDSKTPEKTETSKSTGPTEEAANAATTKPATVKSKETKSEGASTPAETKNTTDSSPAPATDKATPTPVTAPETTEKKSS